MRTNAVKYFMVDSICKRINRKLFFPIDKKEKIVTFVLKRFLS